MAETENSITGALSASTFYFGLLSSKLSATTHHLKVSTFGVKKFDFKPENVIALKKRKFGLQILHNISDYPSFIIFWGNPKKIMAIIKSAGFVPTAKGNQEQDDEYQLYTYLFIVWAFFSLSLVLLVLFLMLLSR